MATKKMCALFLAAIFCFFLSIVFAKTDSKTFADELDEYLKIFEQIYSTDNLKEKIEIVYPRIIKNYETFIKKYPRGRLADDAKLRIAEFYNLSSSMFGEDKLFPDIKFNKSWKTKANKWLNDIVKNHPFDEISDPKSGEDFGEPTPAFALYYLYSWNNGDKKYLKELIDKYPWSRLAIKMSSRRQ